MANWWIMTAPRHEGGERVLGPFVSRDLALTVRSYVEQVEGQTFWVLPDGGHEEETNP